MIIHRFSFSPLFMLSTARDAAVSQSLEMFAETHALIDGGGGQPIQPSLVPLLRFAIQGVALAA